MEFTRRNSTWLPSGMPAPAAADAMNRETIGNRMRMTLTLMLPLGEPAQAEYLHQRDVQVHHPQAADATAHIHVVPIPAQLRDDPGEVVAVPIIRPGKDQQEESDLET